jgi:hypothetical protein
MITRFREKLNPEIWDNLKAFLKNNVSVSKRGKSNKSCSNTSSPPSKPKNEFETSSNSKVLLPLLNIGALFTTLCGALCTGALNIGALCATLCGALCTGALNIGALRTGALCCFDTLTTGALRTGALPLLENIFFITPLRLSLLWFACCANLPNALPITDLLALPITFPLISINPLLL